MSHLTGKSPPPGLADALRADVDDGPAWQVFADWLIEQGDPRGELVVVERAARDAVGGRAEELRVRAAGIRQTHGAAWTAGLEPPAGVWLQDRHGFVVGVRAHGWSEPAREFLVRLYDDPAGLLMRALEVDRAKLDDDSVRALLDLPGIARLRELRLREGRLSVASVEAIATSGALERLVVLDLARQGLTPAAIRALVGGRLGALRELGLADNAIGDEGLRWLARSPLAAGLRVLRLQRNVVRTRGVWAAFERETLGGLQSLSLSGNPIGDDGLLAVASGSAELRGLWVGQAWLTGRAGEIVAGSTSLTQLETLHLPGNSLGLHGVRSLLAAPGIPRMCSLDLDHAEIGDAGAHVIAASRHLTGLQHLSLRSNGIGSQGAIALAFAPSLHTLRRLRLQDNPIGAAGVDALRSSPVLRSCRVEK